MIARSMYEEAKDGRTIGLLGHTQSIELFLILSMKSSSRAKTKHNALKAFVGQEQAKPRFSQPRPVKRAVNHLGGLISELDSLAAAHYQSCISTMIDDGSNSSHLSEREDAQVALSLTFRGRLQNLLEEPSTPMKEGTETDVQCLASEVSGLEI